MLRYILFIIFVLTAAKFQKIIRVTKKYTANCKNRPCSTLQGRLTGRNLSKNAAFFNKFSRKICRFPKIQSNFFIHSSPFLVDRNMIAAIPKMHIPKKMIVVLIFYSVYKRLQCSHQKILQPLQFPPHTSSNPLQTTPPGQIFTFSFLITKIDKLLSGAKLPELQSSVVVFM